MGKNVTFGHVLTIIAIIVLPLLVWGVSVETRFEGAEQNTKDVNDLQIKINTLDSDRRKNHLELMEKLHLIELQLMNKENRK